MANTKSIDLERDSSQYLSITDVAQTGLDITGDMSIMCWVKLESVPSAGQRREFASKWDNGSNQRSWFFSYIGTPALEFINSNDGSAAAAGTRSQTLTVGTWYHIAMAYDASAGEVEFFVDGSSIGTAGSMKTSLYNSSAPFLIGARMDAGSPNDFQDSLMDEVGVYNAVLSDATILADYNSGDGTERSGSETSIVGGWRFDDDLLDVTANNNDLTNNNSATFSADVPFVGETTGNIAAINSISAL